jgi:hypothetical protein
LKKFQLREIKYSNHYALKYCAEIRSQNTKYHLIDSVLRNRFRTGTC